MRLSVRVVPGARRTELVGSYGPAWKIRVAAPPDRGRANEALLEFLAEVLALPRRRVSLVAGASARDKVIEVIGISQSDADRLLAGRREGDS